jgi:hypothetical protein
LKGRSKAQAQKEEVAKLVESQQEEGDLRMEDSGRRAQQSNSNLLPDAQVVHSSQK